MDSAGFAMGLLFSVVIAIVALYLLIAVSHSIVLEEFQWELFG